MTEAQVVVRLYAAAAAAAGADEVPVPAGSLADVLAAVGERAPDRQRWAGVLERCSVLVDGLQSPVPELGGTGAQVPAGAVVDVLPPFAGG